jgi:hypothetical protein
MAAPGCALFRRAPPPPPIPRQQVIEQVRAHTTAFHTVKDGDISLHITTTEDGKPKRLPSLGGVIAFNADLPGLRIEAEKMTKSIFSLKALGDRFWLALYETQEMVVGGPVAYSKLPSLIRPDEVRGFFSDPEWLGLTWQETTMTVEEGNYRFDVRVLGMLRRQVSVDRRQLVVTTVCRYDALGRMVTRLDLGDYEETGGTLFPHALTVDRPLDGVKVELELGDPKLNVDLPVQAFRPTERPGWKVIDLDREPLSDVKGFVGE